MRSTPLIKFFIPALLIAWLAYLYVTAKPPGYCEEQKRVIPDGELYVSFLDTKIKTGDLKLGISETSGRDYLVNHPRCCHIDRTKLGKFHRFGLFEALFGKETVSVSVTYEMSEEAKTKYGVFPGSTRTDRGALMEATTCGKILAISEE